MSAKENRRAARSRHDSVVEIFDESGRLIAAIGRMVNISKSGLCFSSVKTLAKGQKVNARLRLLKEGTLEVSGHIVWVKKKMNAVLYGVQFDAVRSVSR